MMAFLVSIAEVSPLLFGALLLFAQLIVYEVGIRLGLDSHRRGWQSEAAGIVVGGMMALLAFVLALTLTFAHTRYTERRQGTMTEANAIGTAWLRANAVGGPQGTEIARRIEEYNDLRKAFIQAKGETGDVAAINDRSTAMQSEIWGQLTQLVREQPNPISASLMSALNEMFDASTSERFAFQMRLPSQIFWLLIAMAMLSMGCLGFQMGLKERPARVLVALLSMMWTIVIVDILDLSAPRIGNFRTSAALYDWNASSFKSGPAGPPATTGKP
ncbi:hypothetical protein OSH10_03120 [Kaistia defluvii]|uniref:bestrophin-like domain n=1 Tax=Kaistia defluvii TaxID=410841 RepID=UPI00224F6BEA|nr:hypothetical protein [Kaistia defluvii]MCX5517417.1 hypothetical protein [Kaistia defluvii]